MVTCSVEIRRKRLPLQSDARDSRQIYMVANRECLGKEGEVNVAVISNASSYTRR
jgi:hypothetical protein